MISPTLIAIPKALRVSRICKQWLSIVIANVGIGKAQAGKPLIGGIVFIAVDLMGLRPIKSR